MPEFTPPPPPKKIVKKSKNHWLKVEDVGTAYYSLTQDKVPCVQTIRNWIRHGKVGYNGDRIKLKHELKNGKLLTTTEWLQQFVENLHDEGI